MLIVGDSTALKLGEGLAAWSIDHPEAAQVDVLWQQGLTFMLEPSVDFVETTAYLDNSRTAIGELLPRLLSDVQPDVVALMVTVNDVSNRTWTEAEGSLTPADPQFTERNFGAYRQLTGSILASGVPEVAWIIPPVPINTWDVDYMNDPTRYAAQHDTIRRVMASFGDGVSVIELDQWMAETGHGADQTWRTDGVHLERAAATAVAEQYVGPLLVQRALGR
jgi:lysophospholipase L1-like esterase